MMTVTGVAYARLSKKRGDSTIKIEDQLKRSRWLAKREGITLLADYRDNRSASRGLQRDEFEEMVQALRGGTIDYVVCYHYSRLTRDDQEAVDLLKLLTDTKTKLLTKEGTFDLSKAGGRAHLRDVAKTAINEADYVAERTSDTLEENAADGLWSGGSRPYGYTKPTMSKKVAPELHVVARIIPEEAEAIRKGAKMILSGQTSGAVADAWNAQGLKSSKGNPWSRSAVRQLFQRPYLCGVQIYRGEALGKVTWQTEQILTQDTWESVVRELRRRATGKVTYARKHLLVGFLFCKSCGTKMGSGTRNNKFGYMCRAQDYGIKCPKKVSILGDRCEERVRDYVIWRIASTPEVQIIEDGSETSRVFEEIEGYRQKLTALIDLYMGDDDHGPGEQISKADYLKRKVAFEASLKALESRLTALQSKTAMTELPRDPDALAALWDTSTLDWQRALVNIAVSRIDVLPASAGNKWDPRRIVPQPR